MKKKKQKVYIIYEIDSDSEFMNQETEKKLVNG